MTNLPSIACVFIYQSGLLSYAWFHDFCMCDQLLNLERPSYIFPYDFYRKNPRGILISPGPGENNRSFLCPTVKLFYHDYLSSFIFSFNAIKGTPQDSGISLQTVLELGPSVPLFGVCMGLQCIGEAFGGSISLPQNMLENLFQSNMLYFVSYAACF